MMHNIYFWTRNIVMMLGIVIGTLLAFNTSAMAASSYQFTGIIDFVNLKESFVVIDDSKYNLTVSTRGSSQTMLKKGMRVGYDLRRTDTSITLSGIWILTGK